MNSLKFEVYKKESNQLIVSSKIYALGWIIVSARESIKYWLINIHQDHFLH